MRKYWKDILEDVRNHVLPALGVGLLMAVLVDLINRWRGVL